jgi:hypothetical protein
MTHFGVGPPTTLAFELVIGTPERFCCGKQRQVCRSGAVGRIQRRSATDGRHQQTGQLTASLPAGGSGASHGAQPAPVAQLVLPHRYAARAQDREGGHGAQTRGSPVLEWSQGWDYEQWQKLGSQAGTPGNRHGVQ